MSIEVGVWDDLRFPVSTVNPPGQASDPDIDTVNGTLLFDATGIEVIFLHVQFPHKWKAGSIIFPHVHWMKTTSASGNVLWRFEYKKAPIGEVMDASFTSIDASIPEITDNNLQEEHLITSFGELELPDFQISDMLIVKLSRIGNDALDTYNADAMLLEFDIHYQIDSNGSRQEYIK